MLLLNQSPSPSLLPPEPPVNSDTWQRCLNHGTGPDSANPICLGLLRQLLPSSKDPMCPLFCFTRGCVEMKWLELLQPPCDQEERQPQIPAHTEEAKLAYGGQVEPEPWQPTHGAWTCCPCAHG